MFHTSRKSHPFCVFDHGSFPMGVDQYEDGGRDAEDPDQNTSQGQNPLLAQGLGVAQGTLPVQDHTTFEKPNSGGPGGNAAGIGSAVGKIS